MNCPEAVEAILEAEPSELEGQGDAPLPQHIRSCSRCRSLATAVLHDQDALARELTASLPDPDLDALLDRAWQSAGLRGHGRFRSRRTLGWALVPVAAAAAAATLFLAQDPSLPGAPYQPSAQPPGLGLEVPADENVAVMATSDPAITVLWFY